MQIVNVESSIRITKNSLTLLEFSIVYAIFSSFYRILEFVTMKILHQYALLRLYLCVKIKYKYNIFVSFDKLHMNRVLNSHIHFMIFVLSAVDQIMSQ